MKSRTLSLVAIQTDPNRGVHHETWGDWEAELVLFEAEGERIDMLERFPYGSESLRHYLTGTLRSETRTDLGTIVEKLVARAVERIGPWVDAAGSFVTAALEQDEADESMTLVVADRECRQVVRLLVKFEDEV